MSELGVPVLRGDEGLWIHVRDDLARAARAREKRRGALRWGSVPVRFKYSPLAGKASLRHGLRELCLRRAPPRLAEFDNLEWLRRHGFRAPRPLLGGCLLRNALPCFQFLYTEEVSDTLTLREAWPALEPERQSGLLDALARDVAHLHALGFIHRDLFPRNLLVQDGESRIFFLDAWRGGAGPGLRGAPYDLACLMLFLPALITREAQGRFFDEYIGERARRGAPARRSPLLRSVERNRRGLVARLQGRPSPEGSLEAPLDWTAPL